MSDAAPPGPPITARSIGRLLIATAKDSRDERVLGLSAEIAFFALLSLPPLLLVVATTTAAVTDLIGADVRLQLQDALITALGGFLSADATDSFVRPAVEGVFSSETRGGIFSVSLVVALWSASRLTKVLIESMNIAYNVEEWRSGWRRRLMAVGLTLVGLLSLGVLLPFIAAGPSLGRAIDGWAGTGAVFSTVWSIVYWPTTMILGIMLLASLYHAAPNWWTPWRRELPGATLAVVGWVIAALALRVYIRLGFVDSALGTLGAPVVIMLYLYVTALAVLVGAELNGEIERMWPSPRARMKVPRRLTDMKRRLGYGGEHEG